MTVEILVRLDDNADPRPLRDLAWEHIAPCGCTCGVMDASYIGADRDAAYRHYIPDAERRRRDQADGFQFKLAVRDEVCERLPIKCGHTPTWGVERVTPPAGYEWGESAGSRRTHLVPVPEDARSSWRTKYVQPLCGSSKDYWIKSYGDLANCTRCERKARAVAAESAADGVS